VDRDLDDVDSLRLPCEPSILRDTLNCLFENARSACQGREFELRVVARRERTASSRSPNVVKVTVSDSGSGIANENVPFIFLDGFTTNNTGKHKGRGLSLACAQLLQYHGDLQLEDAIGRSNGSTPGGATFVLRFRLPDAQEAGVERDDTITDILTLP
jgi:signal transduction histidine kinase